MRGWCNRSYPCSTTETTPMVDAFTQQVRWKASKAELEPSGNGPSVSRQTLASGARPGCQTGRKEANHACQIQKSRPSKTPAGKSRPRTSTMCTAPTSAKRRTQRTKTKPMVPPLAAAPLWRGYVRRLVACESPSSDSPAASNFRPLLLFLLSLLLLILLVLFWRHASAQTQSPKARRPQDEEEMDPYFDLA